MEEVQLQIDERGVATVLLDRPQSHHALTSAMISRLAQVAIELGSKRNLRVVVLGSKGPVFCAGADLNWMKAQFSASFEARRREALKLARMLRSWNELPLPLIARVQGNGYGGALGLMAVADNVLASRNASFTFSEVRLGLIPATISPFVLARIGVSKARERMLDASVFSAETARNLGLVNRVVEPDMMDNDVEEAVTRFLRCSPKAIARAKALLRRQTMQIDDALLELVATELAYCWESSEARHGVEAFFERRKPKWNAA